MSVKIFFTSVELQFLFAFGKVEESDGVFIKSIKSYFTLSSKNYVSISILKIIFFLHFLCKFSLTFIKKIGFQKFNARL